MALPTSPSSPLNKLVHVLWGDWQANQLWQRIVKASLACTIAISIAVVPQVVDVYGLNTYLIPMTVVFAHPGQRMAMMIESLALLVIGASLGLAWALLGLYLSTLATEQNLAAGSTIRALFCGGIVLLVNIAIFPELSTSFLGKSTLETLWETLDTVERATHWFITTGGDSPEAKQRQSGASRASANKKKQTWWTDFLADFPNPFHVGSNQTIPKKEINLTTFVELSSKKPGLRAALARCKMAQDEVNFEFSISPLSPKALKPISKHGASGLVQNVVTLINACENKYVMLSAATDVESSRQASKPPFSKGAPPGSQALHQLPEDDMQDEGDHLVSIDDVKPLREITTASVQKLEAVLQRLREPVSAFGEEFRRAVLLLMASIAYCYDVETLPSGLRRPDGVEVEEVDLYLDAFLDAIRKFDERSTRELKLACLLETGQGVDIAPRMEMFLISSFILGLRQSALQVLQMLHKARELVDERRKRHDRPRLWVPHYADIGKWLSTTSDSDVMILPNKARKETLAGKKKRPQSSPDTSDSSVSGVPSAQDEEQGLGSGGCRRPGQSTHRSQAKVTPAQTPQQGTLWGRVRENFADILEWAQQSDDLAYALRFTLAVMIVSWPSFVSSWRQWYGSVRGIWAPIQLVLAFEVSIGTSIFVFLVRLTGVIFGCILGFVSYEIGDGNRVAMVAVLMLGIVFSFYVQVGTKYVKAGMVATTSMCVVATAAISQPQSAVDTFQYRLVAFLVGALVALAVEVFVFPSMHSVIQVGISSPSQPNFRSQRLHHAFSHARNKAQASLDAADAFLPFCLNEPRLKGSFKPFEPIYQEIIYVLHQIIDRLDTVVDIRKAYGSSMLEDLHAQVYAYRRNAAAANNLMLFSVHEAMTTWLPLPQFLPSPRIAQLRLVSRVREVVEEKIATGATPSGADKDGQSSENAASFVTQRKFLAWNANAAGLMEIVEYLEELVELTKILVGVNAFRSGLFERSQYSDYVEQVRTKRQPGRTTTAIDEAVTSSAASDTTDTLARVASVAASVQRFRRVLVANRGQPQAAPEEAIADEDDNDDALPASLRRVGSRVQRQSTVARRRGFSASTS
ncbi:putative membrane protein-like protein [Emericellopsis cladophorae]|uniref:Membrane protein-like protein n=1 Tax=Emericellopsis cladophorae TaxID=2686198 RepID=A0A9Q0BGL4_9HYPO|nr:putative membrane protein-like protein [Emericellopsis cladophorae]KAI6785147.1 putative membrane protein-like protein [Emericellopsis cladophorae]